MTLWRCVSLVGALLVSCSVAAAAQSSDHVYVDIGFAAVRDEAPRLVLSDNLYLGDSSQAWSIGGGAWLTHRVAVGVEWLRPESLATSTSGLFGKIAVSESEQTIVALARVRAWSLPRVAVDAVAGVGALLATTGLQSTAGVGSGSLAGSTFTRSTDYTLAAWTAGADLAFEPVRHLQVGGAARVYSLRGEPPTTTYPGELLSIVERSTTRFTTGVFLRGSW